MRICLVSRELDPFFGAGIGVYASASARAWAKAGHEIHVVTVTHTQTEPPAQAGGPLHHPTEPPAQAGGPLAPINPRHPQLPLGARLWDGVVVHVVDPVQREDLPYFHLRHALGVSHRVSALHAAHPFDYIEFADYFAEGAFALHSRRRGWGSRRLPGALLGVRLHTPSIDCWAINQEHDLPAESVAMGPLEYRALAAADVLISPSTALLDRVNATLGARRLRQPPGHVVPYPFDAEAAEFHQNRAIDAPSDEIPTVLCFGRLERRKGVHVLVQAAAQLLEDRSPARVVFVGGDTSTGPNQSSMREHLLSLVPDRWRGRITIEPAVPRHAMLDRIRSSTLCCFPAIWDNFPNALLEAMALGKPIVATSGSGIAEIIQHGRSGLLVQPDDAQALAAGLELALSDKSLREQLGGEAQKRVRELCHPAQIVSRMEALIRRSPPSMRRQFRRWPELAPAAESLSPIEKLRRSRLARRLLHARRRV